MSATWKTVRVFISSTFRDMQAERNWLVKRVFPALRQRLEPQRIHLIDIDLRWGITGEQADNDAVLGLCLQQIDECRPFFLGLLGERYGWVPSQLPIEVGRRYGWTQAQTGKSITELEILHGVLNDPAMHGRALFCLRSKRFLAGIEDRERRRAFIEVPTREELRQAGWREARRRSSRNRRQLAKLKERIRSLSPPLRVLDEYPCGWNWDARDPVTKHAGSVVALETFGGWVIAELERAILDAPELRDHLEAVRTASRDDLAEERSLHERLIETRTRVYVERDSLQDALMSFVSGSDTGPCLVTGPSGSGKSAAFAHLAREARSRYPQDISVPYFIGASPRSTALREMLRHFCGVLGAELRLQEEVASGLRELTDQFRRFLAEVPADRRALLMIDALNQLDETDHAQTLHWLPWDLPAQVRLIVSCVDDPERPDQPALKAIRRRRPLSIKVEPLTDQERLGIMREVPSIVAKSLDEAQLHLLQRNEATRNPLFLLVALEELRGFGSFEQLNRRIGELPDRGDALTAIFRQVIQRLRDDFDAGTVDEVLTLLASSRRGLSERELLDLIEGEAVGVDESTGDLLYILRQLRPYLQPRGPLLDFFHRHLAKAIREEFFAVDPRVRASVHRRLASYFGGAALRDARRDWRAAPPRVISELPYQVVAEGSVPLVEDLIGDPAFLEASVLAGLFDQLLGDLDTAANLHSDDLRLVRDSVFASASAIRQRPHLALQISVNRLRNNSLGGACRVRLEHAEEALARRGTWLGALGRFDQQRRVGAALGLSGNRRRIHVLTEANEIEECDVDTMRLTGTQAPFAGSHPLDVQIDPRSGEAAWLDRSGRVFLGRDQTAFRLRTREHALGFFDDGLIGVDPDDRLVLMDPGSSTPRVLAESISRVAVLRSITPDGRFAVFVSGDREPDQRVLLLSAGTREPHLRVLPTPPGSVCSVCLDERGSHLLIATRSRVLKVFDLGDLRLMHETSSRVSDGIPIRGAVEHCRLALGSGGPVAILASHEGELCVWDCSSGTLRRRGHYRGIRQRSHLQVLEFLPGESDFLVVAGQSMKILSVAGSEIFELPLPITQCLLLSDGHLVTASRHAKRVTWFKDGQRLYDSIIPNQEPTSLAARGPSGEVVIGYQSGVVVRMRCGHEVDEEDAVVLFDRPVISVVALDGDRTLAASAIGQFKTIRFRPFTVLRSNRPVPPARQELFVRRLGKSDDFVTCSRALAGSSLTSAMVVRSEDARVETVFECQEWIHDLATSPDGLSIFAAFDKSVRVYRRIGDGWSEAGERAANAVSIAALDDGALATVVREGDVSWLELWLPGSAGMQTVAATELPLECSSLCSTGARLAVGSIDGQHCIFAVNPRLER